MARRPSEVVAENMAYWLWVRRMTLTKLSETSGVSKSQLSQLGKRDSGTALLHRVAKGLGISVALLTFDVNDPANSDEILWGIARRARKVPDDADAEYLLAMSLLQQMKKGGDVSEISRLLQRLEGRAPRVDSEADLAEIRRLQDAEHADLRKRVRDIAKDVKPREKPKKGED